MKKENVPNFPAEQRKVQRREMDRTCSLHTETIKAVFEKIDKMLPIWVFLATISIIGAVFSYITYLNHSTASASQASIKEISDTIHIVKTNQAVVLFRLDGIGKDIDDLKQQHKIKD